MRPVLTPEQRALLRTVALHIANTCEPEIPDVPGNARVYGDAWLAAPTTAMPAPLSAPAFDRLASLLPGGVCWGDPVTPELVAYITQRPKPVAWRWGTPDGWQFTDDLNQVPAHTACEALFLKN